MGGRRVRMGTSLMKAWINERTVALLLLAFGILIFLITPFQVHLAVMQIPGWDQNTLSPKFFPRLVAICFVLAGFFMFITNKNRQDPFPVLAMTRWKIYRIISIAVYMVSYYIVLLIFGFYIASPLFLIALARGLGYKNWPVMVFAALSLSLVVLQTFSCWLKVIFPEGYVSEWFGVGDALLKTCFF